MYYIKHNGEKIELDCDKIYCDCPICGKEQLIELSDTITEDDPYINFDSNVICENCTENKYSDKYAEAMNNGTWQKHGILMLIDNVKVRERIQAEGLRVFVCPVTGTLQITNDNGLEILLDLFIAINKRNGTL